MRIAATLIVFTLPAILARLSDSESNRELRKMKKLKLTITNLTGGQPFSPFFVMVHNKEASLFEYGEAASAELAVLAENGDPSGLVSLFDSADGVLSATAAGGALGPGASRDIEVEISSQYSLVTLASMAVNTNDCFVALKGVYLGKGGAIAVPGLDAGSEENDEKCENVPGPACTGDENGSEGEGGFVRVHNGIFGVGDLEPQKYDWLNPMMRVAAKVTY